MLQTTFKPDRVGGVWGGKGELGGSIRWAPSANKHDKHTPLLCLWAYGVLKINPDVWRPKSLFWAY